MALDNLPTGSYLRYKNDTATFTTWLAKAAHTCGYTPHQRSGDDPANPTQKCQGTPVKEIIIQAKYIIDTTSPWIRLPASVERTAKNAINARKKFTIRFTERGVDLGESNSQHPYFTDILEQALYLVKQRHVYQQRLNHRTDTSRYHRTAHSQNSNIPLDLTFDEAACNRFGLLEVEDFGDADVVIPSFEQASLNSKASTAPQLVEPDFSEQYLFFEMII